MSDKKLCTNCKNRRSKECKGCHIPLNCLSWHRDPHKWLDIPPNDFGFYFWRESHDDNWIILEICSWTSDPPTNGKFYLWDEFKNMKIPVEERSGEWQGPITPHD